MAAKLPQARSEPECFLKPNSEQLEMPFVPRTREENTEGPAAQLRVLRLPNAANTACTN